MDYPKFFRFPFAATGDKTAIPDDVQQSGGISYAEGYGFDYERNPATDPQAKRIERDKMNQIHHDITANVQQYQLYGAPWFYDSAANGNKPIAYAKGAQVRYNDGNGENNYISLINNNTNLPSDTNSWFKFDPSIKTPINQLNTPAFVPVVSMTETTPPLKPVMGESYLIPAAATGHWTDKRGQIAEWNGQNWIYTTAPNGHAVGLPNGDIYSKVGNQYWPQIALDNQSGKWLYAEAAGSTDALTATLTPKPMGIWAGMSLRLKVTTKNAGAVTLDLNELGAKKIVYHENGESLVGNDFQVGDVLDLIYDGKNWRLQPTIAYLDKRYSRLTEPPSSNFYVIGPTGNDGNSGLSATPQEGFATIQGAINAIGSRYLTRSTVTINVSAGTYDGFSIVGSLVQNWQIVGNPNNPQSVLISARDVAGKNVRGCVVYAGNVTIRGLAFRAYYEGAAASGGNLSIHDCSFELSPQNPVIGAYRSQVSLYDTITFSGTTSAHVFSLSQGGSLVFGYTDIITYTPVNVRYLAGTSCGQNMYLDSSSTAIINPRSCTFTGTLNGRRYNCSTNSVILTYGGGEGYLPGTQAGVLYSGGQIS